jgi:hypothetical protein
MASGFGRFELGVHEPPMPTARLIADILGVPLAQMHCEYDKVAALQQALPKRKPAAATEMWRGRLMGSNCAI